MTLASTLTTLDTLAAGQGGTVIHLTPTALQGGAGAGAGINGVDVARRLMELGFVPGERIRMLRRGLQGGPLAIKVGQSTFALRRFEAALVSVKPE